MYKTCESGCKLTSGYINVTSKGAEITLLGRKTGNHRAPGVQH